LDCDKCCSSSLEEDKFFDFLGVSSCILEFGRIATLLEYLVGRENDSLCDDIEDITFTMTARTTIV